MSSTDSQTASLAKIPHTRETPVRNLFTTGGGNNEGTLLELHYKYHSGYGVALTQLVPSIMTWAALRSGMYVIRIPSSAHRKHNGDTEYTAWPTLRGAVEAAHKGDSASILFDLCIIDRTGHRTWGGLVCKWMPTLGEWRVSSHT